MVGGQKTGMIVSLPGPPASNLPIEIERLKGDF